jgi:HK97 family phage portal protein
VIDVKFTKRVSLAWQVLKGSRTENIELNSLLDFLGVDRELTGDALNEATYFACIKVLSESLGKLPLKLMKHDEDAGVISMRNHPLYYVLHNRPNPYMTSTVFWSTMERCRDHFGNAFALITGYPTRTQLWVLDPTRVEIWWDNARLLKDVPDIWYKYSGEDGREYLLSHSEVLHLPTSNTHDGIVGKPVRQQLAETILGGRKSQKLLNKMYETGFTAKAVLQYTSDLSDESAQKYRRLIERYISGNLKSEGLENIIPLEYGSTLTPLNMKLSDGQFLETKQYTALQIASAFGIKPMQIGDYSKSSYASAEAQQLDFYISTMLYIIKQYEEELTEKLLTDEDRQNGLHFKFNVSVVLRADQETQMRTLSTAVTNGVYTPNEARRLLDMPDRDGGDRLYVNGNVLPIELAGIQYTRDTGGENDE